MITQLVQSTPNMNIVAGTDVVGAPDDVCFPAFTTIRDCEVEADVMLCFLPPTAHDELLAVLDYAEKHRTPLILGTTAMSEDVLNAVDQTSKKVAILQSANMSLGINLLVNMIGKAAKLLYDSGFDTEIIEKHHNKKLDAPSGTAFLLADAINHALNDKMTIITDRSTHKHERASDEIGIQAIRAGSIIGEHSVIFAGQDEVIELKHSAASRDVFGMGALKAAAFIYKKPAGLYSMQDVINHA